MKAVLRAAMLLVSVAAIAAAGTASVRAASPTPGPLIGGALDAKPGAVTLTSHSTMPVAVVMSADGPFTLEPSTFTLDPGETQAMTVSGDASGHVSAAMTVLDANVEGDTSSVTLEVAFPKPAPPPSPLPLVAGALVALLAAALVGRRLIRFARSFEIRRKEA